MNKSTMFLFIIFFTFFHFLTGMENQDLHPEVFTTIKNTLKENLLDHISTMKAVHLDRTQTQKLIEQEGLQKLIGNDYVKVENFLESLWKNSVKKNLLNMAVERVIKKFKSNQNSEKIEETIKDYFIELIVQECYASKDNQLLSSCTCRKASLDDKIYLAFKTIADLTQKFSPDQCNQSKPVVGSFFGAGELLNEYLLTFLIGKYGYEFINLYCIDRFYNDYKRFIHLFITLEGQLARKGIKATVFPMKSIEILKNNLFFHRLQPPNFIVSIDPGDTKKINRKKALTRASIVTISLFNFHHNTCQTVRLSFENLSNIKSKTFEEQCDCHEAQLRCPEPMTSQSEKLSQKILKFIGQVHESRTEFILQLEAYIDRKRKKIEKNSTLSTANGIELSWFESPKIDFKKFAEPYTNSSTLILMVDYGLKELCATKKRFKIIRE